MRLWILVLEIMYILGHFEKGNTALFKKCLFKWLLKLIKEEVIGIYSFVKIK